MFNFQENVMGEWISVEDRLPDSGQKVVAANILNGEILGYATVYYFSSKHGVGWDVEDSAYAAENYDGPASIYLDINITHWMPLPEPPKQPPSGGFSFILCLIKKKG